MQQFIDRHIHTPLFIYIITVNRINVNLNPQTLLVFLNTHPAIITEAYLTEKGIYVCCVNALCMKKFCVQALHRAKTDRIDSIKIAQYGLTCRQEFEPVKNTDEIYRELRIYSRQYHQYRNLPVKAKINPGILLDQAMPGAKSSD